MLLCLDDFDLRRITNQCILHKKCIAIHLADTGTVCTQIFNLDCIYIILLDCLFLHP